MTTLHLGVLDMPYDSTPGKNSPSKMTGEVAEFLERKYHLMETFAHVHEADISRALEHSMEDALHLIIAGTPAEPYTAGMSEIETAFRTFLSSMEAERVGIPGTPTQAALKGVNHRRRHPYAKSNPRRPSFIDTDLLETSFRAWIEE